jgi:hypothetical protein
MPLILTGDFAVDGDDLEESSKLGSSEEYRNRRLGEDECSYCPLRKVLIDPKHHRALQGHPDCEALLQRSDLN